MKKHEVDLLIVEDNEAFNLLMEKELSEYLKLKQVKDKFHIRMFTFFNSEDCIQTIRKRPANNDTITFIDYYLGEAVNGLHVLKLLNERNKNMQVVLMSRSPNVEDKLQYQKIENINIHFIVKDEYTPAICKVLLEDFLENL